ncbi:MAG: hypothetical protein KAJ10_06815 [Thermodesulfovibrionia bacterium]|nr:hypothetical protein [Thermodesulfovibrionia bacterium]
MNRLSLIMLSAVLLTACITVAPPTIQRLSHYSELKDEAGTLLVVDVCLKIDTVGDDDYFVIKNAKEGAQAFVNVASQYMLASGLTVVDELFFVCGALHDNINTPKRIAKTVNGDVELIKQPFAIDNSLMQDAEYISALQDMATFAYQSAILKSISIKESNGSSKKLYSSEKTEVTDSQDPSSTSKLFISPERVKAAFSVVAERSHRSSLVYIGITGNSRSSGKKLALGSASFLIGMSTGLATGVSVVPFFPADANIMTAGLINLQSGTLIKSNLVQINGDPMNPEVLAQSYKAHLLLRDLIFSNFNRNHY